MHGWIASRRRPAAPKGSDALLGSGPRTFRTAVSETTCPLVDPIQPRRILVVSALADKLTAIEAIEKGACGFLCKPFTDRQLNDALRKMIA